MSTIKSSAENLTLNADGANNDIIFQSNGSNVATLDQAGTLTATTFTGAATDATKLPLAGGTLTGNTTIATNSTPKLILKRTGNNAGNGYIECHGADDSVDYKIAFAQSSGVMSFDVGGTRMLGVTSDGLCFNSDTAAANALDDYEEGTFTPTLIASSGSATSYTSQAGSYTKIGNLVHVTVDLECSKGTLSGQLLIDSFPFTTSVNTRGVGFDWYAPYGTAIIYATARMMSGTSRVELYALSSANNDGTAFGYTNSFVSAVVKLRVNFSYKTNS